MRAQAYGSVAIRIELVRPHASTARLRWWWSSEVFLTSNYMHLTTFNVHLTTSNYMHLTSSTSMPLTIPNVHESDLPTCT